MHDRSPAVLHRRRLLSASLLGLAAGGMTAAAPPAAAAERPSRSPALGTSPAARHGHEWSFAVVTDTHADVDVPDRTAWLTQVFSSIASFDPAFVLHCGDLTEYGGDGEYDAYLSAVPASLRPKLRHVPGNHEVRWDRHGKELFHRLFGPTPFSFDVGGLHVAGLDPTQLLQEPGRFGREHLRWLTHDLARAGGRPSLLFLHYPLGAEHYYVDDQDEVLDALSGTSVRAIFAGHIHREQVVRMNGFTQVAADDAKGGPIYYRVDYTLADGHPVLRVSAVTPADGGDRLSEVVEIPLDARENEPSLRPRHIDVTRPEKDTTTVRVRLAPETRAASVHARPYPQHIFGGADEGSWIALTDEGSGTWSARIDLSALPPGTHRMQVRVADTDDARYEATAAFELPGGADLPVIRWHARLPGAIQGALATNGGAVIACTTDGHVEAFRPRSDGRRSLWSVRIGPVFRGPALDRSGRTVFVPSADHHLYALRADDGRQRWRLRVPEPVLSSPLVATVGDDERVFFTAGTRLYAVGARDGRPRWSSDLHGFFAGRVACDGTRIYAGGGDGNAYAFDAATGDELWSFSTNSRETAYSRLIYGPWDDVVETLPRDRVLVSTVTEAFALDRTTGEQAWAVPGSHIYAPARRVGENLLLIDEWGVARLVDGATGEPLWQAELPLRHRVLNAGPVVVDGTAWVVSATGLLASLDLATGAIGHVRQVGRAQVFSTPAVVDDMLIVGDQDGVLRAVALPSEA